MNYFLISAGLLSIVVGLVHSVLGEVLIFKKLRNGTLVPQVSLPPLRERHIRILWATWHLASIFGLAIGFILIDFSMTERVPTFVVQAIAIAMLLSSGLVFYATQGKHPGWIGLLSVAVLCWLA